MGVVRSLIFSSLSNCAKANRNSTTSSPKKLWMANALSLIPNIKQILILLRVTPKYLPCPLAYLFVSAWIHPDLTLSPWYALTKMIFILRVTLLCSLCLFCFRNDTRETVSGGSMTTMLGSCSQELHKILKQIHHVRQNVYFHSACSVVDTQIWRFSVVAPYQLEWRCVCCLFHILSQLCSPTGCWCNDFSNETYNKLVHALRWV